MMQAIIVCSLFYLTVMALCHWKPNAGRLFLGVFYLIMAWGVNFSLCLTGPEWFVELGRNSTIPLYRTIFTELVAAAPLLFGLIAVAFETTVGLLLLSKGIWVKIGATLAIIFLIGITPLDTWALPNPILALTFQFLLSKEFDTSLVDQFRLRFAHR